MDVVFVIDGSGSIGSSNFQYARTFIRDVFEYLMFSMSPHQLRLGLIQYGTSVYTMFDLNNRMDVNQILTAVDRMPYYGGFTNTPGKP